MSQNPLFKRKSFDNKKFLWQPTTSNGNITFLLVGLKKLVVKRFPKTIRFGSDLRIGSDWSARVRIPCSFNRVPNAHLLHELGEVLLLHLPIRVLGNKGIEVFPNLERKLTNCFLLFSEQCIKRYSTVGSFKKGLPICLHCNTCDLSRSYLMGQSNEIFDLFFHNSSLPGPLSNGLK